MLSSLPQSVLGRNSPAGSYPDARATAVMLHLMLRAFLCHRVSVVNYKDKNTESYTLIALQRFVAHERATSIPASSQSVRRSVAPISTAIPSTMRQPRI